MIDIETNKLLNDAKHISKELRLVQEKYKDKKYQTFEIRVGDMARDSADIIDKLIKALEE